MSKILVTGGAGYVGSHTVYALIARGYEVVVFDNLYMGHREAVHPQATFFQGDLLNRDDLQALFAAHQFQGIFHFASHTMVGESTEKPWLYLRDNVVAASNLLEMALPTMSNGSSFPPPPTCSTAPNAFPFPKRSGCSR
jgi:UDP-glucose 4-epimerase